MHSSNSQSNLRYIDSAQKSKKQKRRERRAKTNQPIDTTLDLSQLIHILPKTDKQQEFFNLYNQGNSFINLHGLPGVGKTFVALYKALEEVLDPSSRYRKVIIVRTAVQSRDQGFLPGNIKEKMDVYTEPYRNICASLFNRKDAWNKLVQQNVIEFCSTSFLRGMTFDNSIIIFDELQNGNKSEIDTVVTRLGNHTKIIFCGDYRQTDLNKGNDKSGILEFMNIVKKMKYSATVEFGIDDIVRSKLVKDYIIASLDN